MNVARRLAGAVAYPFISQIARQAARDFSPENLWTNVRRTVFPYYSKHVIDKPQRLREMYRRVPTYRNRKRKAPRHVGYGYRRAPLSRETTRGLKCPCAPKRLICRSPNGVPEEFQGKFVYEGPLASFGTGTAGFLALTTNFAGNSMHLRNPLMYDEYTLIWPTWVVTACKFTLRVINTDEVPLEVVCFPTQDSTGLVTIEGAKTQKGSSSMICGTGDNQIRILMCYAETKRICGLKDCMDNANYKGALGANPSKMWYFQTILKTTDGGDISAKYSFRMEFYAIFMRRANLEE